MRPTAEDEKDAPWQLGESSYHLDDMLKQSDAARRMGYSLNYFKKLKIPHIGEGRAKRYRWGDIRQWMAENKICPASMSSGARARKMGSRRNITPPKSVLEKKPVALPISEALALLTGGKQRRLPAG
jgi:hypothetical protein